LQSYEASLDCPRLNGRRNVEDIIAGHKATGSFEPDLWHLLLEHGLPRGVLILSPSIGDSVVELVYLGLSRAARGRGLGDLLMSLARHAVSRIGRQTLSLAVDSINEPALKLYFRHGLAQNGSRLALLRELKSAAVLHPCPPENSTPTA
jgi:ribosomal protein S18 acetylase RimI-like enzyme